MNRAFQALARCAAALVLLAIAFMPLGQAGGGGQGVGEGAHAAALVADENCDDDVSLDMVSCGSDFAALGLGSSLADNGVGNYLQMPREVCEDLVDELLAGRWCRNGDADCERERFRRGDLAPSRTLARAMVAFDLDEVGFPPLLRSVGRRLRTQDSDMPASWLAAPPHGPPRVA